MEGEKIDTSQEAGYRALKGHIEDKAKLARQRHGPNLDSAALLAVLEDRDIVRHPTKLVFDASRLREGEFGIALRAERDGERFYELVMHDHFRERGEDLVLLAAYHIPSINYVDLVTHEEAELFGATLAGLEVEAYYERICKLADELGG